MNPVAEALFKLTQDKQDYWTGENKQVAQHRIDTGRFSPESVEKNTILWLFTDKYSHSGKDSQVRLYIVFGTMHQT